MRKAILVVEENWQDRALLSLMLEGAGYSVIHALNGEEASHVFARHKSKIAVVVLGKVTTDPEGSFAGSIQQMKPVVPIFSKSAEPWTSARRFRETSETLKPLPLMIQISRALDATPLECSSKSDRYSIEIENGSC